jgi:hypothetical protein
MAAADTRRYRRSQDSPEQGDCHLVVTRRYVVGELDFAEP